TRKAGRTQALRQRTEIECHPPIEFSLKEKLVESIRSQSRRPTSIGRPSKASFYELRPSATVVMLRGISCFRQNSFSKSCHVPSARQRIPEIAQNDFAHALGHLLLVDSDIHSVLGQVSFKFSSRSPEGLG